MADRPTRLDWEAEFTRWLTPCLEALGHKARRRWAPVYLQGLLGKTANCQVLVSLTLARGEVPVPVALRLSRPETWTDEPARGRRAGVPERVGFRPKWPIALEALDRGRTAGATFGTGLAEAGSGACAAFRRGLNAWRLTRRHGTKGPLTAAFAAVRVRPADGPRMATGQHLPGEPAWLVCERHATGEQTYDLTNHPPLGVAADPRHGDHGARGVRAGPPATRGRAGPRPLRRPLVARAPSPYAAHDARLRLPAALAPAPGPGGGKNPARGLRPSQPCPPSVASSSPTSLAS